MIRRLMFASSLLVVGLTQNAFGMEAAPVASVEQSSVVVPADGAQKLAPAQESVKSDTTKTLTLTEIKQLGEPSLQTFYMIPVEITVRNNTDKEGSFPAPYFASNDQTLWNGDMIQYKMRNFFRKATSFCIKKAFVLACIATIIKNVKDMRSVKDANNFSEDQLNTQDSRGMMLDGKVFYLAGVFLFLALMSGDSWLRLSIDGPAILKPHGTLTVKGYVSKAGMEKMAAMVEKA